MLVDGFYRLPFEGELLQRALEELGIESPIAGEVLENIQYYRDEYDMYYPELCDLTEIGDGTAEEQARIARDELQDAGLIKYSHVRSPDNDELIENTYYELTFKVAELGRQDESSFSRRF